ncbi:MAG: EAL domain-containing protein [Solirubrobacterales bacterium]|nr:EAL domain-containing protein [Solirubrobacterales bacterium]
MFALEIAFDLSPIGMAVLDENLGFRMVNKAYCQMLGYRREELLFLALSDITHPEDHWLDHDWYEFAFDERTETISREKRMVSRDGETIWVNLNSQKLSLDRDSSFFTVSTVEPITGDRKRQAELSAKADWTARIEEALSQDNLVLHGQPIIDLRTGEVSQHELLLRMTRGGAARRLVMPGEFMPPAEKYGLVHRIDQWVVARALELARRMRVTINLSGSTISRLELIDGIERAVRESEAPPENLVFEITETGVVNDLEAAEAFIARLHQLGCKFALDDFGTGYGTFAYLKRLPVDYLKIDIEFVRDMVRNESDRRVVEAITATAGTFGMETIAEGVEDADTLELLRDFGVDYAQGFHIGRPAEIGGEAGGPG